MNEQDVGQNIRHIRQKEGKTLTELAAQAGMSKSTLSKIETGRGSAPISTLIRLADALRIPVATFFAESDQRPAYAFTRKNRGRVISRDGTRFGYSYEGLALDLAGKSAEPFLLTIRPGDPAGRFQHGGEEFLYMLSGRMQFTIGDERLVLRPGDALYFDPCRVHETRVLGSVPVRFLCVFVQRTPSEAERGM